jgi:hypothetical protein
MWGNILCDQSAQFICDFWPYSEPELEPSDCLVQQHAESIEDRPANCFCMRKKRRFQRYIYDVSKYAVWLGLFHRERELSLTASTQRRGVDDDISGCGNRSKIVDAHSLRNAGRQRGHVTGAALRPVYDADG